nr:hypothetical protein [Tanacetum cinerariifolium]
ELEVPIEDQPLPTDASPTALLPGYTDDSNPEEDEEDPVDYPANGGDNDDNESSDDDVEKDGEDDEEEEHLAPIDPSVVPIDDHEAMTTVNQGMSVEEIKRVVAQRVGNAIEAIAIYETKTNIALKSMSQIERQKEKVAENSSNKRKWEGNHNGSLNQQNKGHKCKVHHNGLCAVKCGNCKKVGHIIQNNRTPATAKNQRTRTYYECRSLRHYKSECSIVKFHKHVDMIHERVRASKPKTMQDAIEIETKLMNKKISTLAECQAENKKRLDNTSKNYQNQQQPNKRQNIGRDYTARHREKNITADLSHCVLNATITMMVHVLPNATSATDLAI